MNVSTHDEKVFWNRMAQTIGDAAAKWWLGVAAVLTSAGILWGASFAFQTSLAMQRLNDKQDDMGNRLEQVQNDVNDIKHRLGSKP